MVGDVGEGAVGDEAEENILYSKIVPLVRVRQEVYELYIHIYIVYTHTSTEVYVTLYVYGGNNL